jgi:SWI/SNF-related matrix-associated actin-dependent regulator 1 of chromatin subfamily A
VDSYSVLELILRQIPCPEEVINQKPRTTLLTLQGELLTTPYPDSYEIADEIKRLGGRWNKEERVYKIPFRDPKGIAEFLAQYVYGVDDAGRQVLDQKILEADATYSASSAADSNFHVDGLNLELRPFQRAGVQFMTTKKKCINGDSMGLGKTVQAIASLHCLQSFPAVVFSPKSVKSVWYNEAAKWTTYLQGSTVILNGKIKPEYAEKLKQLIDLHRELGEVNREKLRGMSDSDYAMVRGRFGPLYDEFIAEKHGVEFSKRLQRYWNLRDSIGHDAAIVDAKMIVLNYDIAKNWLPVLLHLRPQAVVADECHMLKSSTAARTKAVRELASKVEYCYLLSGSPLLNRPSEFVSYLQILGVLESEWGGWQRFVRTYCGAVQGAYGWEYGRYRSLNEQNRLTQELNRRLRETRYIRRVKKDRYDKDGNLIEKGVAQDELPEKQISTIVVDITNRKEYDRAEEDVIQFIYDQARRDQEFRDSIKHLPPAVQAELINEHANSKATAAERAEHLARINQLRQVAARGKTDAILELAESFRDADEPFLLFAWHREIVEEMATKLKAKAITGQTPQTVRDQIVTAFQNGTIDTVVANLASGGVGLTLTGTKEKPCSNSIFGELDWRPPILEQAEDRSFRIGTTSQGINIWYVLGADTIDEEMWSLLEKKRTIINTATEGNAGAFDVDIMNGITDWLKKKGKKHGQTRSSQASLV